jgi:DNA polymerase III gamma/tau subunit
MIDDFEIKWRPNILHDVIGQDHVTKPLEASFNNNKMPHKYLFYGPTGTGKTTIARIVGIMVKCSDSGIIEIDAASNNSIEFLRELRTSLQYPSMGKKPNKMLIMDECFHSDTSILTINGNKMIRDISIGEMVFNKIGIGTVTDTFINRIPIERVVKIITCDGVVIFSSDRHVFFTTVGEIEAHDLDNNFTLLCKNVNLVSDISCVKKDEDNEKNTTCNKTSKYNDITKMREMSQEYDRCMESEVLQEVCKEDSRYTNRVQVWLNILLEEVKSTKEVLFRCLCNEILSSKKRWKTICSVYRENKEGTQTFCTTSSKEMEETKRGTFKKNEGKQSYVQSGDDKKDVRDKENKWYTSCMEWYKRWKRSIYNTSKDSSNCIRLEDGNIYFNRSNKEEINEISNLLQSRCRKQEIEDGNRSRWEETSDKITTITRQKEREEIRTVRVESVEIYQRGNNDESFKGIIEDKERNQGYVEFYDLEIDSHPSYYVNNILVHNCHRLRSDGWDVLLKITEEPPDHVYIALCTTEFNKVPATIKGRFKKYGLKEVDYKSIFKLVSKVAEAENIELSEDSLKLISRNAAGCPREALVGLEQCRYCEDKDEVVKILSSHVATSEARDLCRLVAGYIKPNFKDIQKILNDLQDKNPESIRIVVANYLSKCVLSATSKDQMLFFYKRLNEFSKPIGGNQSFHEIVLNTISSIY